MKNHPSPERLNAWADAALGPDETLELDDHIQQCDACEAVVAELVALSEMLNRLPLQPIPAGLESRISRAVIAEQQTMAVGSRSLPVRHLLAAFAALSLATTLILLPIIGVGLGPLMVQAGLAIKNSIMLARDLVPVVKALFLVAQQVYIPLVIATAVAAALPMALAGRLMGPSRPQLGSA